MATSDDNSGSDDMKPKLVEKPPEQMDVDVPAGVVSTTGGTGDSGEVSTSDLGVEGPEGSRSPSQSDDGLRRGRKSEAASDLSGPADVSARVLRPESLNTSHDWLSETRLKGQMHEGSWNFHELLGAPICANVVDRSEDADYCEICLQYVEHVCNAIRDADASIDTALRLRTLRLTINNRTGDAARLEGEVCAVRAMLRDRDNDLFRMNKECIKAIADRKAWSIEADKAWSVVKDFKRRNDKLSAELQEAKSEIDRLDGGRSRKTPHVERTKMSESKSDGRVDKDNGLAKTISTECGETADSAKVKIFPQGMPANHIVNTTNGLSEHAPTDEDITMEEVGQQNIVVNWKDLHGLARMVVRWPYSGLPGQPPPKGTWTMKGFMFTALEDYQAAHAFMHDRTCCPVGLTVFAEYWQARVAKQLRKEVTPMQKWALDNFQMPLWLWDIFQMFNIDSVAIAENRRFWQVAKCPAFDDSIQIWAAFIQRGGCPPDGLEFVDEFGTLESRMICGLILWLQISYPRPKHTSSTRNRDVDESWAVVRALMYMVLYPDAYGTILRQEQVNIAPELKLENWCTTELVTDEQAARRFARMGITIEIVHDMYPFVMRLAESVLSGSRIRKGWDKTELKDIVEGSKVQLAIHGLPSGINVSYGTFIPRPPGLPWPDSQMNKVQERGVFLLDIPLLGEDGTVTLVTMRPVAEPTSGKPGSSSVAASSVSTPPAPSSNISQPAASWSTIRVPITGYVLYNAAVAAPDLADTRWIFIGASVYVISATPADAAAYPVWIGQHVFAGIDVDYLTAEAYRRLYRRNYNSKSFKKIYERLHSSLSILHTYDDHEITNNYAGNRNDSQPPFPSASDTYKIYNADANYNSVADQHYYNFRYGDTAFFVLDTHRYRTPATKEAPGTMLGETQSFLHLEWKSIRGSHRHITPFGRYRYALASAHSVVHPTIQVFAGSLPTRPTKVDTLGTSDTLAGFLPIASSSSSQEASRRRDVPPHISSRGVPAVSGLAPPSKPSFAFGSKVPATADTRAAFPTSGLSTPPARPLSAPSTPRQRSSYPLETPETASVPSVPSATRRHSAPYNTPIPARYSSGPPSSDRRGLSPIAERTTESTNLSASMEHSPTTINFPQFDQSQGADTSHAQAEESEYETREESLRRAFYKDDEEAMEDDEPALAQRLMLLKGKMTLEERDIVDEGEERDPRVYRYRVDTELLRTFAQASYDLQWYLMEAARECPSRTKYFKVDPGRALIPSLEGSSDPQQLRVAWDLLRARFELGLKFFDKYIREASGGRIDPGSPTSTRSSVIQGYEALDTREQQLRHLITYYPHHKDYLPTARERLQSWGEGWGPLYERRASSASPQRADEEPGREHDEPQRFSNVTHRATGKQRESWPDNDTVQSHDFGMERNIFSPLPTPQSVQDLMTSKSYPSPTKAVGTSGGPNTTLLGRSPKYKSSSSFLDQINNQSVVAANAVPFSRAEPNILKNLLAGPTGSKGEQYRAVFGKIKDSPGSSAPRSYVEPADSWRRQSNINVNARPLSHHPGIDIQAPIASRPSQDPGAYVPPPMRMFSATAATNLGQLQLLLLLLSNRLIRRILPSTLLRDRHKATLEMGREAVDMGAVVEDLVEAVVAAVAGVEALEVVGVDLEPVEDLALEMVLPARRDRQVLQVLQDLQEVEERRLILTVPRLLMARQFRQST
ncbi:hypothetical protein C8R47DRAFT_1219398 [Mycena vitilis]|nr:hypothetical protein C8R47DRAFT_1219398 [Mycena vitilis]